MSAGWKISDTHNNLFIMDLSEDEDLDDR